MTKAPDTVDFMPPEALEDVAPTPSQTIIINPETGLATGGRTEAERHGQYFEKIDRSRSDVLIPLIESCLSNLPKNRPSIVRVCDQLEGQLVDSEPTLTNES